MMKYLAILLSLFIVAAPAGAFAENSAWGEIKPAPWSGDWWSRQKGLLIRGWQGNMPSPFEKYDSYVAARTGRNPGAHAWEANIKNGHYNPNAEGWEGHCNGWSAASILTNEPRSPKTRNGITFTVADQKGILSEQYMNTYCKFYGNRNWGNPNDDVDDIYPDEFHRLLMEYIASQKSAVVVDIAADRMVWNYPMYKFESSWRTAWFDDRKLKVTTTCYFADDNVRPDYIGTKWFTQRYTYNLFLDDNGNIVSGEWTGSSRNNHPDFVWVPTADAPNPNNTLLENPRIDPKFTKEITEGGSNVNFRGGSAIRSPDECLMQAGLDPAELF